MERNTMGAPTITLAPLTGSAINEMILDYMALSGDRRRAELAHFLESGRTTQSDIMAMTLRGMILRTSA
jgi:hypothetical protein